ncbi:hypothetical protein BY996DRAFT_7936345 [Phakopsora pachyrhizi]|nr:hypothetical protein BY996DRAFT_7936345 [Phakopsora pachyrhizi]
MFFSVYIAVDSILNRNSDQLIALCVFNILMATFGSLLSIKILEKIKDYLPPYICKALLLRFTLIPIIILISSSVLIYYTYHFFKEFGWKRYKHLGGNIRLNFAFVVKKRLFMFQKFTLFAVVGLCVLIVQMRREKFHKFRLIDFILPIIGTVLTCLAIMIVTIGVELEIKSILFCYAIYWIGSVGFLAFDVIRLLPLSEETNTQGPLIFFLIITFMMKIVTGLNTYMCYQNFEIGLKEARQSSRWLGLFKNFQKSKTDPETKNTGLTSTILKKFNLDRNLKIKNHVNNHSIGLESASLKNQNHSLTRIIID